MVFADGLLSRDGVVADILNDSLWFWAKLINNWSPVEMSSRGIPHTNQVSRAWRVHSAVSLEEWMNQCNQIKKRDSLLWCLMSWSRDWERHWCAKWWPSRRNLHLDRLILLFLYYFQKNDKTINIFKQKTNKY